MLKLRKKHDVLLQEQMMSHVTKNVNAHTKSTNNLSLITSLELQQQNKKANFIELREWKDIVKNNTTLSYKRK